MDLTLVMFKDNGESRSFKIGPGKTVIGRREQCELRIPLSEISRKHAMLMVAENAVTIRDLGSANGTYVNNIKISEQSLTPGDHVVIGPVVFTVQINGEPAEVKPAKTRLEARAVGDESSVFFQKAAPADEEEDDFDIDFGEDDPISELEAMAGSEETAQIDLEDSHYDLDIDDDSKS